ncbi:MAG: PorV/PorQ family protein [bacterium]
MIKYIGYTAIFLLILVIGFGTVFAEDGDGGYAASYFQIPIGARPTAMGGAYIAVANDGAGPLFNPAGIATLQRKMFATSFRTMGLGRKLGYVTFMAPARDKAAIGVNWHYFSAGDIETRDYNGRLDGYNIGYTAHDWSIIFAKRFEDYMSLGMRAGYIYNRFAQMSSFSVGLDLGAMFYFLRSYDFDYPDERFLQDLQIGVVLRNMAGNLRWNSQELDPNLSGSSGSVEQVDRIPFEVGVGFSGRFLKRKLLLATDIIKNEKQNIRLHSGAEYFVSSEFALRTGYSDGRFTAGTGYIFKINAWVMAVDYAFSTDKAGEGSEHIFSFDILF